jgi:alanine racemase
MLSIGYEHGYLRRFSNISKAYIKGSFAPIVGKIAMSVTCIDVTDIPAAQIGDEVTLIGSMSPITARDLSVMIANQSIREIVVSLSNMVERKLVNIPAPSQEKLYNFALEKPLFSV